MTAITTEEASKRARERVLAQMRKNSGTVSTRKQEQVEVPQVTSDFLDSSDFFKEPAKGAKMYSDCFVGAKDYLTMSGKPDIDISSLVFDRIDWAEEDQPFIPELDANYVWQHDVLYPTLIAMKSKLKVLYVGATGTGKTTFHENLAAVFNQPFYLLGGRGDMESDTILGHHSASSGQTSFTLGELTKAVVKGYYILLDEIWKVPSNINMALQRLLQRNGFLQIDDADGSLKDKQFFPAASTRIMLADNVVGTGDGADKYAATMVQDGSTINRVDLVIRVNYLPFETEVKMLCARYGAFLPEHQARKMVQVASKVRAGFETGDLSAGMSPRNLFSWAEMAQQTRSYEQAFEWVMLNRFADETEKGTVKGFYELSFDKKL